MNGMHLDCACCSLQSAMKSLGRKEKEKLGSTLHEWHTFRLCMPFMAECHEEFGKEGKRKIGQHSVMNGTHFICSHAIHGRVP